MSNSQQWFKRVSVLLLLISLGMGFFVKGLLSLDTVPAIRVTVNFVQLFACGLAFSAVSGSRHQTVTLRGHSWLWLTWLFLSLSAVGFSQHFYPSLLRQLEVLLSILLSFLLIQLAANSHDFRQKLAAFVSSAIFITAIVELVGYFYLSRAERLSLWVPNRLISYFSVRHFGHLVAILSVFSVYYLRSSRAWVSLLGSLFLLVALTSLFFCGGKASVASTLFVIGLFVATSKSLKTYVQVGSVFSASYFLALFYFSSEGDMQGLRGVLHTFIPMGSGAEAQTAQVVNSIRYEIWETSWLNSMKFPILGLGPDGYIFIQPHIWGQSPHNFILQFALDWGWPAALIASAFFFKRAYQAVMHLWSERGRPSLEAYSSAGFFIFFLNGLVSSTFYQPVNMLMLSMLVGLSPVFTRKIQLNKYNARLALSPKVKRWLIILFLTGGTSLNLIAFLSVMTLQKAEKVPEPDSAQARLVHDYPFSLLGYYRWVRTWENKHPEVIIERCQWAEQHGELLTWPYYTLESRYQRRAAHLEAAENAAAKAYLSAGENEKFRERIKIALETP